MAKRGRPIGSKNGVAKALDARKANAAKPLDETPPWESPAASVEVRTDNKPVPSPTMIADWVRRILDIETEMASLSGVKGGIFNQAEKQGMERGRLRAQAKLAKMEPEEAAQFVNDLIGDGIAISSIAVADLRWTSAVTQSDMFPPAEGHEADELSRARAKRIGFKAGKLGHNHTSNPYIVGTPSYVGWADGLREGLITREILKPGSANVTQASTERKRRKAANSNQTTDAPMFEQAPEETDSAIAAITDMLASHGDEMFH